MSNSKKKSVKMSPASMKEGKLIAERLLAEDVANNKASEFTNSVDEVLSAIDSLNTNVGQLEHRLGDVLYASDDDPTAVNKAAAASVPLLATLQTMLLRIQAIDAQVQNIKQRLVV